MLLYLWYTIAFIVGVIVLLILLIVIFYAMIIIFKPFSISVSRFVGDTNDKNYTYGKEFEVVLNNNDLTNYLNGMKKKSKFVILDADVFNNIRKTGPQTEHYMRMSADRNRDCSSPLSSAQSYYCYNKSKLS